MNATQNNFISVAKLESEFLLLHLLHVYTSLKTSNISLYVFFEQCCWNVFWEGKMFQPMKARDAFNKTSIIFFFVRSLLIEKSKKFF